MNGKLRQFHMDTCRRMLRRCVAALLCLLTLAAAGQNLAVPAMAAEKKSYCGKEAHTHGENCYEDGKLVCTLRQHTHELICYSNPRADKESSDQWWDSMARLRMTGIWREDVMQIARSQLGYRESTSNYAVLEDGKTIKGYTRYGDWYGYPYGDWCAMFISFCYYYAGVEEMPLHCSVPRWLEQLQAKGMFHRAGTYTPRPGDLVFIDWQRDGRPDHVGLVSELVPATANSPAKLITVEGNYADQVCCVTYGAGDGVLYGYGALPEQARTYRPLLQAEDSRRMFSGILTKTNEQTDSVHNVRRSGTSGLFFVVKLENVSTLAGYIPDVTGHQVVCAPYGIGSHRLLVRGERLSRVDQAAMLAVLPDARQVSPAQVAAVAVLPVLLASAVAMLLVRRRRAYET